MILRIDTDGSALFRELEEEEPILILIPMDSREQVELSRVPKIIAKIERTSIDKDSWLLLWLSGWSFAWAIWREGSEGFWKGLMDFLSAPESYRNDWPPSIQEAKISEIWKFFSMVRAAIAKGDKGEDRIK